MTRRRVSGTRSRARSGKPKYHWNGIYLPSVVVPAGGVVGAIVTNDQLDPPFTLMRIRGNIHLENANANNVVVGMKMLIYNVNDAGGMTDDISGLDTDLADIQTPHLLWQWAGPVNGTGILNGINSNVRFDDIDIKAMRRVEGPKVEIGLVVDVDAADRAYVTMQLRCLIRMH